jgi:inactivated superfamily I helicase
MGLSRLEDVSGLDVDDLPARVRIPVRLGFSPPTEGEDLVARRRSVDAQVVRAAVGRARRCGRRLSSWAARDLPVSEHGSRLHAMLDEDLGWEGRAEADPLRLWLAGLIDALPDRLRLGLDDLRDLLDDHFEAFDRELLGGEGGGVQVLEVVEARARTFEHLFLVGCNRGVFPRPVQEDALLPDTLRHVLSRTGHGPLPDLAEKREGFDEERFLFAQLLAAGGHVTLSWLEVDDDHRAMAPSPLVERLRAAAQRHAPGPSPDRGRLRRSGCARPPDRTRGRHRRGPRR